jgi:predicted kinase
MAAILLITGPPGAGKSTVARGLAEQFAVSAHLKVDDLREIMVNGFAPPGEWTDEVEAQFRRARASAIHLARTYAGDGIVFIIDDVCVPAHFQDHYEALLDDPSVTRIALRPSLEVLRQRLRDRAGPWDEFFLASGAAEWSHSHLSSISADEWILLDSSNQTSGETVAAALEASSLGSTVERPPSE